MFDFMPQEARFMTSPPVLFLSNAFGAAREWDSIALCLGSRGACQSFDDLARWTKAAEIAPNGAHLVAHGSAAYDALRFTRDNPDAVRSLTLVDPDLIAAFPELADCHQFRRHSDLIRGAADAVAENRADDAAAMVIDWWMGKGTWNATTPRLQARFAKAVPALANDWQRQRQAHFDMLSLMRISTPVRIVTGRRVPSDVLALSRLMRTVLADISLDVVKSSGAVAHLTDPHIVAPEICKFIVSSDIGWQDRQYLAEAA